MIMNLFLAVCAIIAAIYISYIIKGEGCSGDCNQGRRECNCKGKK